MLTSGKLPCINHRLVDFYCYNLIVWRTPPPPPPEVSFNHPFKKMLMQQLQMSDDDDSLCSAVKFVILQDLRPMYGLQIYNALLLK